MILLRSAVFNLLFFGGTAVAVVVLVPTLALPRTVVLRVAELWSRSTMWLLARVVGLRHEVRGREHLPPGAAIVAAKHQSAWDTFFFHTALAEPAYVVKRELLAVPFYGWYLRKAGMIGIDRRGGGAALKRVLRRAAESLAAGRSIVIFPEGTRTAPGARRPYQVGVAALYTHLAAPVAPVALNSGLFWGRRSFVKRPGVITVEILPPIPPGLTREAFMAELERRLEPATDRLCGIDPAAGTARPASA